jgi:hypothetical protein
MQIASQSLIIRMLVCIFGTQIAFEYQILCDPVLSFVSIEREAVVARIVVLWDVTLFRFIGKY